MGKFNRAIPYNDLPLLPPKADIETKNILRKTISASRALAQLNGTLLNLPNPTTTENIRREINVLTKINSQKKDSIATAHYTNCVENQIFRPVFSFPGFERLCMRTCGENRLLRVVANR
jgi:hypothetical protein